METGTFAGRRPDLSDAYLEHVSSYMFALTYRSQEHNRGLCLHVFGPVSGRQEEILRFDCFEAVPHYHLGWSYRDEPFIQIDAPHPFEWTIDALETTFEQFVQRAGGDLDLAPDLRTKLPQALERLRLAGRRIEAEGTGGASAG